jgi:hypothetical protein
LSHFFQYRIAVRTLKFLKLLPSTGCALFLFARRPKARLAFKGQPHVTADTWKSRLEISRKCHHPHQNEEAIVVIIVFGNLDHFGAKKMTRIFNIRVIKLDFKKSANFLPKFGKNRRK